MSIERKKQKIFAEDASNNDISVIGSKSNDNPQYSKDLDVIQSLSQYSTGLRAIVNNVNAPYLQDHNSLFYLITKQLAYIFQAGIPEWESNTEYVQNRSVVLRNGQIYVSKQTGIGIEPEVTENWTDYWSNLSTVWGKIGGDINKQTDLLGLIGSGYYAVCNTPKTETPKTITIDKMKINDIGAIPVGTKIRIKFNNGVSTTNGRFVLRITVNQPSSLSSTTTFACYCYVNGRVGVSLSNKENVFIKSGEIVEFTVTASSVDNTTLVCDNIVVYSGINYKVYRDGSCEQYDFVESTRGTKNLFIPMYDTNYFAFLSNASGYTESRAIKKANLTTTTITITGSGDCFWQVIGYANCSNL